MAAAVVAISPLRREVRRQRTVVAFVAAYLSGFAAFGIVAHRSNTGLYLIVTAGLVAVFTLVHLRVRLSEVELRALALLGFLHLSGGLIPAGGDRILYNVAFPPYPLEVDRVIHAFGAGVITLVAWRVLQTAARRPAGSAFVLVALAGLGASALEEVAEFLFSQLWHTNVGGYVNTGWDLVFDLAGCVAVGWWLARVSSTRSASDTSRS